MDGRRATVHRAQVCIYCEATGDDASTLLKRVESHFGLAIRCDVLLVPLARTRLLRPDAWPRFTLLGQLLGSLVVAWGALAQLVPEVRAAAHCWRSLPTSLPERPLRLSPPTIALLVPDRRALRHCRADSSMRVVIMCARKPHSAVGGGRND